MSKAKYEHRYRMFKGFMAQGAGIKDKETMKSFIAEGQKSNRRTMLLAGFGLLLLSLFFTALSPIIGLPFLAATAGVFWYAIKVIGKQTEAFYEMVDNDPELAEAESKR